MSQDFCLFLIQSNLEESEEKCLNNLTIKEKIIAETNDTSRTKSEKNLRIKALLKFR